MSFPVLTKPRGHWLALNGGEPRLVYFLVVRRTQLCCTIQSRFFQGQFEHKNFRGAGNIDGSVNTTESMNKRAWSALIVSAILVVLTGVALLILWQMGYLFTNDTAPEELRYKNPTVLNAPPGTAQEMKNDGDEPAALREQTLADQDVNDAQALEQAAARWGTATVHDDRGSLELLPPPAPVPATLHRVGEFSLNTLTVIPFTCNGRVLLGEQAGMLVVGQPLRQQVVWLDPATQAEQEVSEGSKMFGMGLAFDGLKAVAVTSQDTLTWFKRDSDGALKSRAVPLPQSGVNIVLGAMGNWVCVSQPMVPRLDLFRCSGGYTQIDLNGSGALGMAVDEKEGRCMFATDHGLHGRDLESLGQPQTWHTERMLGAVVRTPAGWVVSEPQHGRVLLLDPADPQRILDTVDLLDGGVGLFGNALHWWPAAGMLVVTAPEEQQGLGAVYLYHVDAEPAMLTPVGRCGSGTHHRNLGCAVTSCDRRLFVGALRGGVVLSLCDETPGVNRGL
jgi:hypothetical protein